MEKKLGITELVLRDGHQSLLATRLRIEDMLPIAEKLDQVGFWSIESWGGATFDSCIRYLGEDPWERIRNLKSAMPKTPQQMLLRAQNLLLLSTFVASVNRYSRFSNSKSFDFVSDLLYETIFGSG